jgi:general secretion pathway protein C
MVHARIHAQALALSVFRKASGSLDHNLSTLMSKVSINVNRLAWPGLLAALVWAAAAAGVVYWVLLLTAPKALPVMGLSSLPGVQSQSTPAVAKALGDAGAAPQAPAPNSTQYKLLGVIASGTGQGSALIAVDGQPPKAFRVGQDVTEGLKLLSVTPKQARLQSVGQPLVLELDQPASGNLQN